MLYTEQTSAILISTSLCSGLGIKRGMESRPVFWHMLHLIAEEGTHTRLIHMYTRPSSCYPPLLPDASSVVQFYGVALTLCGLLSAHWQQSRVSSTAEQPQELEGTCSLVELELVTPYEAHLLLGSVLEYLKVNITTCKHHHL